MRESLRRIGPLDNIAFESDLLGFESEATLEARPLLWHMDIHLPLDYPTAGQKSLRGLREIFNGA
jgi:hypothetical protein